MIEFQNVTKRFAGGHQPAVNDLCLTAQRGELLVLLGESGCGKTTTLRMINRLVDSDSGKVLVDGKDVRTLDAITLRLRIGYAFQGIGLFPHMSVAQNVAIVPALLGWPQSQIDARVRELLTLIGLDPQEYADRYPEELSGGQQQRVGVARALAARSEILLMDEPFGALDPLTRSELQLQLKSLQQQLALTIVLVTHDVNEALLLGDHIAVMKQGELLAHGTPQALIGNPPHAYVAELMSMPQRRAARIAELIGDNRE